MDLVGLYVCTAIGIKPLRKVSAAKQAVKLTPFQAEVLVGSLLGDACLERSKPSHNARLRLEQTFPTHASYLTMIYGIFYSLTSSGPSVLIRSPDKRTGKVYRSLV